MSGDKVNVFYLNYRISFIGRRHRFWSYAHTGLDFMSDTCCDLE